MTPPKPRVLICDDSPTYAAALRRLVEHGGELEVVGVSKSAEEALAALSQLRPDLVTMDLELPGMSGLDAVEQIMSAQPVPILVLSSHAAAQSRYPAAALAAGALDALAKDHVDLTDPASAAAGAFRRRLRLLSGARVIRHPRARLQPPSRRSPRIRRVRAIGVCASTGGPHALAAVLGALPPSFPIPVLVVQHISAGFVDGLCSWLDECVPLPVSVAQDGVRAADGVWLAPDDAHLLLGATGRLALDHASNGSLHRPSGDVLLRSLAASVGDAAVAVVLTGMGRDGAEGALAVHQAGGFSVAQDEATSVVFGMPHAAAELGVDLVLPLGEIGPELRSLSSVEVAG